MLLSKATLAAFAGLALATLAYAEDGGDSQDISADFAGHIVKVTLPSSWKKSDSFGSAPGVKLLGYWSSRQVGVEGDVMIRGFDKAPKSMDELAKKLPVSPRIYAEGCDLIRQWEVFEGDGTHVLLVKERFADPSVKCGYWLRIVRMEKVGDKACVLSLYLHTYEYPGSYSKFMDSNQLARQLSISASFKVVAK